MTGPEAPTLAEAAAAPLIGTMGRYIAEEARRDRGGIDSIVSVDLADRSVDELETMFAALPLAARTQILRAARAPLGVSTDERRRAGETAARIGRISGHWARWGLVLGMDALGFGALSRRILALAAALERGAAQDVAVELRQIASALAGGGEP